MTSMFVFKNPAVFCCSNYSDVHCPIRTKGGLNNSSPRNIAAEVPRSNRSPISKLMNLLKVVSASILIVVTVGRIFCFLVNQ